MTVFAACLDRKGTASLLGTEIRYIRIVRKKFFGFVETAFGEDRVCVADREKALVDSLDKPQYSGGISHVVSCFRNEMDAEKLGNYALRIGNRSLIRRLGAVLGESKIRIPARLREEMLEKASDVPYYTKMGNAAGEGRKIREWKVIWNVK